MRYQTSSKTLFRQSSELLKGDIMATSSGGAKLGVKLSTVISNAIVATQQRLLHTKHRLAMAIFHSISDTISEEVHGTLGPIFRDMHASYGDEGPASDALDFMAHKTGQLQALAGSSLLQQGLLWPISAILNNELSPVVYESIATNPHAIPDAGSIASLAAHGLINTSSLHDGMGKNGLNSSWADALTELQKQYPDTGSALDLLRRGFIARDVFMEWSIHNGTPAAVAEQLAKLVNVPISPADAALALLRGNMTQPEAVKAAADWGVTQEDFNILVGNTGEPLGLEALLEAKRRGFIDDARLVRGILQSRTRNEWVDVAKKLANSPMTTADAVEAAVQNQMTTAQASSIADQNGLEPGMFPILYNTAGSPLSRTEMEELYNRGLVTKAQVTQAVAESRLKPKYTELAFELHTRLITARELGQAVQYGSITHADAVKKAMEEGYSEQDASILVSGSVNAKLQTQRMGVVRAVETLYENNAISQEQATAVVGKMGFEPSEAAFIFQAAEFRRQEKLIAAAIGAVRSRFIARHIDASEASALIDAIGVPHQQRDSMLQVWQIEHDANVKVLTPAQIIKYNKKGLLTDDEALARLMADGYSEADAQLQIAGE